MMVSRILSVAVILLPFLRYQLLTREKIQLLDQIRQHSRQTWLPAEPGPTGPSEAPFHAHPAMPRTSVTGVAAAPAKVPLLRPATPVGVGAAPSQGSLRAASP